MHKSNLFELKIHDAVMYFAFYLVIPIITTCCGLYALPSNLSAPANVSGPVALSTIGGETAVPEFAATAIAYCYLAILISGLNGIYDGINRFNKDVPEKNTKILIICFCNAIVCVYSLYVLIATLTQEYAPRFDWILFAYLGTCAVALWDIYITLVQDTTLARLMGGVLV